MGGRGLERGCRQEWQEVIEWWQYHYHCLCGGTGLSDHLNTDGTIKNKRIICLSCHLKYFNQQKMTHVYLVLMIHARNSNAFAAQQDWVAIWTQMEQRQKMQTSRILCLILNTLFLLCFVDQGHCLVDDHCLLKGIVWLMIIVCWVGYFRLMNIVDTLLNHPRILFDYHCWSFINHRNTLF